MTDARGETERRGDERTATTLKVEYKRLNTFFADYTRDISKGGTFIRTSEPLELGTEFVFVLTVPTHVGDSDDGASPELRLELTGKVKRVVPESMATADDPAGMGIEFVFAADEERERVHRLVTDLMRASLGEKLAEKLLAQA